MLNPFYKIKYLFAKQLNKIVNVGIGKGRQEGERGKFNNCKYL